MRLGVKFERTGMIRYLAHLDFQTMMNRSIRRAGINALYSQGFNPHMLISFCYPLSVGMETKGDYFEVRVGEESVAGLKEKLQQHVPEGVKILKVGILGEGIQKIMSLPLRVSYELYFENGLFSQWMDDFMESESYMYDRVRKGKVKSIDLRQFILEYRNEGDKVYLLIDNSQESSLNPSVLISCAEADMGKAVENTRVVRLETYMDDNGTVVPIDKAFTY